MCFSSEASAIVWIFSKNNEFGVTGNQEADSFKNEKS
jgi:hypothetical protein